jgi:hypothetical protein
MKKTKCKNYRRCGNIFFQYSTVENLCYDCKSKKYNAKRKPEKIKSHIKRSFKRTEEQKVKQTCDYLWSQIIKISNPICWFKDCSEPSIDACHVMSRVHFATRWNVSNGMGGCRSHHRWETDNPKEAKPLVRDFIGEEKYEELRQLSLTAVHYCLQDYLEIKERLDKSLKYHLKN